MRIAWYCIGALALMCVSAQALTLVWNDRTRIEDEVSRYRIYWGSSSHAGETDPVDAVSSLPYENVVDAPGSALSYKMSLPDGVYYFRIVAVDDITPNQEQAETQLSSFNAKELVVIIIGGKSVSLMRVGVNVESESPVSGVVAPGSEVQIRYGDP